MKGTAIQTQTINDIFCILSLLSEYKINIYAYFMSPLNKDNKIIMNL